MFIKRVKNPRTGKHHVYLVEGYRDAEGKSRHRRLKTYGILEDLEKQDPNALDALKAEAKRATSCRKQERFASLELDLEKVKAYAKPSLNYGYVFLESLYNRLGIKDVLANYAEDRRFSYNLDRILRLLVFSRALDPSSKLRTHVKRGDFFFSYRDIKLEDVYRALSPLSELKDTLTRTVHENVQRQFGRDATLVFYDVTNYYFESEAFVGLRQKGVSKERKKTGIVQMGLFLDRNGIPITYELFPGNTNDFSTMAPLLVKIKKDYNLGKITIVADKGNNSRKNLGCIAGGGDAYIIAQRIRHHGNGLAETVLDPEGYRQNAEGTFKWKTVARKRKVGKETVDEHLVCFYSAKEAFYQKQKRGDLEVTIARFLKDPALLKASNRFGVKKYIQTEEMDETSGEIRHTRTVARFDEEKYRRDTELDGYYAIVTNDLQLSPFAVIEAYHGLYKIEESFKVIKSDLQGRPVYVWTDDHIRGHFLVCFLTLTLYRLLQWLLGQRYSVAKIKEALKSASAVKLEQDIFLLHDTLPPFQEITSLWETDLEYDYVRYEDLRKILKNILRT